MEEQQHPPPSLSLQFLNGPRKAETLQFQPNSPIKIGRIIRGNTLTIKDRGISTNHLTIQIHSGNWVLTDLDSSNGTVLDDTVVTPNVPFPIRDGSTIKIGEVTSIVVRFVNPQNESRIDEVDEKLMGGVKGNKKGVNLKARVPVQSIGKNVSFDGDGDSEYVNRGGAMRVTRSSRVTRGRMKVFDSTAGKVDALEEKVEELKNTRVTRNLKNKKDTVEICDLSVGNSEALEEKVEEQKKTRATRNLKNKQNTVEICGLSNGNLEALEEKVEGQEQKKTRATQNLKKNQNTVEICGSSIGNLEALEEKVEEQEQKKTRATRNLKNRQNTVEICDLSVGNSEAFEEKVEEQEQKKTRAMRNLKNKQNKMVVSESSTIGELDAVEEMVEEPKNARVTRNSKKKVIVIEENSGVVDGVENVEKKKTRGGAKGKKKLQEECVSDRDGKEDCDEKKQENLNKDVSWPDLEKMSLGEWLDFMKVYLSKQIIDETEEIIDSMRQKAERLREYVIMHEMKA